MNRQNVTQEPTKCYPRTDKMLPKNRHFVTHKARNPFSPNGFHVPKLFKGSLKTFKEIKRKKGKIKIFLFSQIEK